MQLIPSMDGSLFKSEYKIKINMNLDNIYGKTISEYFIIDLYDLYNINSECKQNNLKHYFSIKENEFFESKKSENIKDNENNEEKKNINDINDFEIIKHKDFISTVKGKK